VWASSADHKQQTELSTPKQWQMPVYTKQVILFMVSETFLTKLLLKIANYMPKLLREKFEIKIPIINRTVAMYM
jgi:hypothetical protein